MHSASPASRMLRTRAEPGLRLRPARSTHERDRHQPQSRLDVRCERQSPHADGKRRFDVHGLQYSNRLSSTSGALTRTYSYDNSGNTTSDGTATFTYNDAGRMISATKASVTTTYALNALGQRVKKTTSGASTYFVYDEAGHLVGEYDNSGQSDPGDGVVRRYAGCDAEAERRRRESVLRSHRSSQHAQESQPAERQRCRVAMGLGSVRNDGSQRRSGWRLESRSSTTCDSQGSTLMRRRGCTTTTSGTMTLPPEGIAVGSDRT